MEKAAPNWTIDEKARAGHEHFDPGYIVAYDRKSATDPSEDVALLRGLGLGTSSTLVDLGAGTGTFAVAAAPFCRRIVAVDVSPAMLEVVRDKATRLGLANIEYVQAGFLTYTHTGEPPNFVYSRNALHHLPDFWKALALRRIATMLPPEGVLRLRDLVFSVEPTEAQSTIERWLAQASIQPEDGWTRGELEEHLRQEYSTFSWLLEAMLSHAGLEVREAEYSPSSIYAAYICALSGASGPR